MGGEALFRIWKFSISGSAYAFGTNMRNVYQVLLAKPERDGRVSLPATRADVYQA
jgi:hypothetical protein